jgi:hypothetical protein
MGTITILSPNMCRRYDYIKPGGNRKDGRPNEDFFNGEAALMQYIASNRAMFRSLGIKNVESSMKESTPSDGSKRVFFFLFLYMYECSDFGF